MSEIVIEYNPKGLIEKGLITMESAVHITAYWSTVGS